jgi:hypothetical protein
MHKNKLINWVERRIKARHKTPDLRLGIRYIGFFRLFRPAIKAHCLDFNRYGMAITSPYGFKEKEVVSVNFKGRYITQSNVKANVTACVKQEEGYRISMVFCYAKDAQHYSRKVDNALSRIESIYGQDKKN